MRVEPGTLEKRVGEATEHALASGALLSIPTSEVFVAEGGVRYFVRVLEALKRKDEARRQQDAESRSGRQADPFSPPDPDLTVGDVTDTHVAVLNKYNVLPRHLLIVTRQFEDQDMLLTRRDFEALWRCLSEYPALGFYNGGREAGASQQHRHLQIVPLPLVQGGPAVPVDPLLAEAPAGDGPVQVPGFPFAHAFTRISPSPGTAETASRSYELYGRMLELLGLCAPPEQGLRRHSRPYCLLVTSTWMLIVPRSREYVEGVSLNSLAYAGSFFVRDDEQLERLTRQGMMNALTQAALPPCR